MKVSELEGALLDYWVAKAEGRITTEPFTGYFKVEVEREWETEYVTYSPSTTWSQGGPIMEDNAITVTPISDAEWLAEEHITLCQARGLTYLIAAMRCYVASKYGEQVPQ